MLNGLNILPLGQFAIAFVFAAAAGVGVWLLAEASLGRDDDRDVAFAAVIKNGNELIARCRRLRPQGKGSAEHLAELVSAWETWDAEGWAVVKAWGSEADVEAYSRENPTDLSRR